MKTGVLALDIGAGGGTKIALFEGGKPEKSLIAETVFPMDGYQSNFSDYKHGLFRVIETILKDSKCLLESCGIASAGVLNTDGSYRQIVNLPFLKGCNIKQEVQTYFDVPAVIINDADAGGLAEWSILRTELLYWVLGGGWGGSWISGEGTVMHGSLGWQGDDTLLHYTNEPGYAVPLAIKELDLVFREYGFRFNDYREEWEKTGKPFPPGPGGRTDCIRAETVVSGTGRLLLYRMILTRRGSAGEFPSEISVSVSDPKEAGAVISRLSATGDPAALNTDRLFGVVLGMAGVKVFASMGKRTGTVPVCMAGKPSLALPFFGPSAQRYLSDHGCFHYLRPSVFLDRGANGNLHGAAVAGERIRGRTADD
ncbi:MAG: ROK family protein [Spirochaetia bacterium]